MKRLASIGFVLLPLLGSSFASAGERVSGPAKVLDGDTLVVAGKVVGLYGVAAPGLKETCLDAKGRSYECGRAVAKALEHHIRQASLTCELREADAYKRALAVCRLRQEDLGAWMVGAGHAIADRRVQAYIRNETPAWGKRIGLWAGAFEDPTGRQREPYPRPNALADVQTKTVE